MAAAAWSCAQECGDHSLNYNMPNDLRSEDRKKVLFNYNYAKSGAHMSRRWPKNPYKEGTPSWTRDLNRDNNIDDAALPARPAARDNNNDVDNYVDN